ncbi:hypothetical protein VTL71DRAFT_13443 [Oculimacula yallundae]|uniref:Phospholipase/carboxylesterase/thioesterase domain-containing protein n=1 Tax=Oculimacula yallundae TaxID=86028 RepID=A0ABR4CKC1_9HELO
MSEQPSRSIGIATHPEPYIRLPTTSHQTTLIVLHGTSGNGPQFAEQFLPTLFSQPRATQADASSVKVADKKFTLQEYFPNCKFVFPTGAFRKVTVFGGQETNAWFDIADFGDRTKGEMEMIDGMWESCLYLADLVRNEIEELSGKGDGKVVLAGLSQGSATGIMLLLTGEIHRLGYQPGFGGFVGFSGWLPFRRQIEGVISDEYNGKLDFGGDVAAKRTETTSYIRRLLGLESSNSNDERYLPGQNHLDVPVFLGHGELDVKVNYQWGLEMRDTLSHLDMKISFKSYEGLHHWINEQEIEDVADFLGTLWYRGEAEADM